MTYREPSVHRLSWHVACHVPIETGFVVGDEACLLPICSDSCYATESFTEPSKDWRPTDGIKSLEFPRCGQVVAHDDAVCEAQRDHHEKNDGGTESYDSKRSYDRSKLKRNGSTSQPACDPGLYLLCGKMR